VSVWLKFAGSADGRAYFGFGATATGTLALVAAPNTGQLILQLVSGYNTYTNLAAVNQIFQANHWYRLEVDWGKNGKVVGKLFDSNGTSLLKQVTAATTAITSGGFSFRAIGHDKYWDTVTATYGVNNFTTTPPATFDQWQALIALAQAEGWARAQADLWAQTGDAQHPWWANFGSH
jgi:hypothetical protein